MAKSTNPSRDLLKLPLHVRAEMAMKAAFEKLVKERLRDGSPLYIWRDGKVVAVPPEEFQEFLSNSSAE
jgi:hypothetical protein